MEQSKLVSSVIAKLKIAYPYYFKELKTDDLAGMIGMYQEFLSGYNELTLNSAIRTIIAKSRYMPTLNEIIEECECSKIYRQNEILKRMKDDGYFKKGVYELDDIHASKNYEKMLMWIEKGIIPNWLLEDMKKYGYIEDEKILINNNFKKIGLSG